MKQFQFQNLFFLSLLLFQGTSCILSPKFEDGSRTEMKAARSSELVRKQIKDIDYRKSPDQVSTKKRVVVLPFLDKEPSKRPESVLVNARTAFIQALNDQEKYIVLEPDQLGLELGNYVIESERLFDLNRIVSDLVKKNDNTAISSIMDAQVIDVRLKQSADQVGLVREMKTSYEVVVRLRLVSASTGQEMFHTVKTVSLQEDNTRIVERVKEDELFAKNPELVEILIKDAFLDFSKQIEAAMVVVRWEGRIAAVRGEKFYLNVGQVSGVKIGDILKVVENPTEVYDSQMGYQLGKVSGKVKGTLEIVSYFGQDGAVGVIHSGAGFKESDRVEFY